LDTSTAQLKENLFDIVHDSQRTFRKLMMALAFPGVIQQIEPVELSIDEPVMGYILQPFLSLLDLETCYYVFALDKELQNRVVHYIEINTNSTQQSLEAADFILCLADSLDGNFKTLKKGTLAQPHKSATVFYLVDNIQETPLINGIQFSIAGPGVKGERTFSASGLAFSEVDQWQQDRTDYPIGIDIFLISHIGQIVGIPRSVEIGLLGGN